jgi:hypothetical protein
VNPPVVLQASWAQNRTTKRWRFTINAKHWRKNDNSPREQIVLYTNTDSIHSKIFLSLSFLVDSIAESGVIYDYEKFAVIRDSVFARGLCVVDTEFVETIKYEKTPRDTTLQDSFPVYLTKDCDIDTLLPQYGLRFSVTDGTVYISKSLTYYEVNKTKVVKSVVTDRSKEKVLQKTINQLNKDNRLLEKSVLKQEALVQNKEKRIIMYQAGIAIAILIIVVIKLLL